MKNKKFLLIFSLCCLSMFLLGVLVGHIYTKHQFFQGINAHGSHKFNKKNYHEHYKKHLIKELVLTSEQQTQLDGILKKYEIVIKEKRKIVREEFKETMNSMNHDVKEILTPDQKEKFEKMSKRHEKRFKHHRRGMMGSHD